jgi:hypothetical protein
MHLASAILLIVALTVFSPSASAARWSFEEIILDQEPLASKRINDIAIGDIDGDGRSDVWVSGRNGEDDQSAWYRNPGPPFADWSRHTFHPGSWKYGAVADLDGDGDLDIVSGFDDEDRVYWAENDGAPVEGSWAKYFMGPEGKPDQILTADLNRDGVPNVIAVYKSGPVSMLSRPEDPRTVWSRFDIGETDEKTSGASVGDVDNDGDLDLLFGHRWFENPLPDGDWTAPEAWRGRVIDPDWPTEVRSAVADIDGDGRNDIVLTGEETGEGVTWYASDDPHAETLWRPTKVNGVPYSKLHSLAVGDVNGDGRQDIMVAEMHTSENRRVTVFEQGEGADVWIEHVIATVGSHKATLADLDGDGRFDIAGKNFEGDKRPRIWLNRIDPSALSLDDWRRILVETDLPHRSTFVRFGDLNADGFTDVAAGAWWWPNPGRIDGDWTRRPIGEGFNNLAVIDDLDWDGDLDLIGTDGTPFGDHFLWAENDGAGGFAIRPVAQPARGDFLQGAAIGSLTDGEERHLVLSWHDGQRTDPLGGTQAFALPSDLRQAWSWQQLHSFSNEEEVALADVDGDGDVDIHLGVAWLENKDFADGAADGFERHDVVELSKGEVDRVSLADINGDGFEDAVIGTEDATFLVWTEHPGGDGTQPWREHVVAEDFKHMSLDIADLDQDGDLDIVSGEHGRKGAVTIYENLDDGRAWIRHIVDPGQDFSDFRLLRWAREVVGLDTPIDHHAGTQLADLDNDGDLDIASIGWRRKTLVLYENRAIH